MLQPQHTKQKKVNESSDKRDILKFFEKRGFRERSVELRCKRSIFSGLPSVLWYRKKRYEEELNEAKGKLKSQVGEKKLIVLITGDIFSAVLHRICCDALHSTQVS